MAEGKGTPTSDSEQDMEPGKRPPWRKRLWGWTGFGEKKLWDWFQLLVQLLGTLAIPVVLAVAAAWFSAQQSETQTQIEEERAQAAALQAYFDQMSTLLLERDLRFSTEDDATKDSKEARILARARTLTVLGRLDPSRKSALMRFLVEAELVQGGVEGGRGPIISLHSANLSGAELGHPSAVELSGPDLSGADLIEANLREAFLWGADLSSANMRSADLIRADLFTANLSKADLSAAVGLPAGDLSYADLSKADLSGADLRDAQAITNEELEQQAAFLAGATMPDGQKYEDWLKSHGEDGENSPS